MCAAEDWKEEELFQSVRRAYPYRNLSRADFDEIVEMLSEGIASARGRYAAYLHRDRVNGVVRARDRKSTRLNSSHGYISYAVFCLKKKKYIASLCVHQTST